MDFQYGRTILITEHHVCVTSQAVNQSGKRFMLSWQVERNEEIICEMVYWLMDVSELNLTTKVPLFIIRLLQCHLFHFIILFYLIICYKISETRLVCWLPCHAWSPFVKPGSTYQSRCGWSKFIKLTVAAHPHRDAWAEMGSRAFFIL